MSETKHDARAAALLESPAALGREDFARRAAACYLLAGSPVAGFDGYRVWPGAIKDFTPSADPVENARMAAAILAAARDRRRVAA